MTSYVRTTLVDERIASAKAIAWDTCHKIYILMDDRQVELMRSYGYDPLITSDDMSVADMQATVRDWYDRSCALKFIDAVTTNESDPAVGFESLVPQCVDWRK